MMRDDAHKKLSFIGIPPKEAANIIISLECLGLIVFERTHETTRIAAANRLAMAHTEVFRDDKVTPQYAKLTRDGALEILDVLLKSGFSISKDDQ